MGCLKIGLGTPKVGFSKEGSLEDYLLEETLWWAPC